MNCHDLNGPKRGDKRTEKKAKKKNERCCYLHEHKAKNHTTFCYGTNIVHQLFIILFGLRATLFQLLLEIVLNGFKRFGASHNVCILCPARTQLKTVPWAERLNALKRARIFIPDGARLCPTHLNTHTWNDVSNQAVIREYNADQIEDLLDLALSHDANSIDLSNFEFKNQTGLTEAQFENLFSHVPSLVASMRNEQDAKKALLMLMMRLKKSATYEEIGHFWNVGRTKASADIKKGKSRAYRGFCAESSGICDLGLRIFAPKYYRLFTNIARQ